MSVLYDGINEAFSIFAGHLFSGELCRGTTARLHRNEANSDHINVYFTLKRLNMLIIFSLVGTVKIKKRNYITSDTEK